MSNISHKLNLTTPRSLPHYLPLPFPPFVGFFALAFFLSTHRGHIQFPSGVLSRFRHAK